MESFVCTVLTECIYGSDELRVSLSLLQGDEVTEDVGLSLMDAIDMDHSGDIDEVRVHNSRRL